MGKGAGAMSLEDFLSRQYGISKTTTGDYKAEETGVFGRTVGYNATDRARQRLDEEMAGMGMSVYDINQAAKMADFESVVPGASVTYGKTPSVFTVEDMNAELTNYDKIQRELENNPAYVEAATKLEELLEDKVKKAKMYESSPEIAEENDKAIATERQTLLQLRREAFGPIVKQKAAFYFGDSYYDVMGSTLAEYGIPLESYMGASTISKDSAVTGDGSADTGGDSADTGEGSAETGEGSAETRKAPTVTSKAPTVTGDGVFSQKDILGGGEFTIGKDAAGNPVLVLKTAAKIKNKTVPAGTIVPADQSEVLIKRLQTDPAEFAAMQDLLGVTPLTEQQYDDMDRKTAERLGLPSSTIGKFIRREVGSGLANEDFQYSLYVKQNADPDTMYKVYIPQFAGKNREFRVKGSDLEFFSDAVLAAGRNPVRIMGVAEEGDNLRNASTKKLEKKFGKRPSERTKVPEKKPAPIPADEDQEKVLKEHGGAIMRAFKERGITSKSSDREVEKALTEWSYDNQVEMPFNRGPIIYALKLFIGDGE